MKYIFLAAVLFVSGCDYFNIGGHTFKQYELMCEPYGGLDRAYFRLGDGDRVILIRVVCKNGVTLDYDYVKKHFQSENSD